MALGSYPTAAYPTGGGVPSEAATVTERNPRIKLVVAPESRAIQIAAET